MSVFLENSHTHSEMLGRCPDIRDYHQPQKKSVYKSQFGFHGWFSLADVCGADRQTPVSSSRGNLCVISLQTADFTFHSFLGSVIVSSGNRTLLTRSLGHFSAFHLAAQLLLTSPGLTLVTPQTKVPGVPSHLGTFLWYPQKSPLPQEHQNNDSISEHHTPGGIP